MNTPTYIVATTFALMSLAACGPHLTVDGARVKVMGEAPADTCSAISAVEGEAGSHDKAEIMLRNHAGEMNANAVVVSENVDSGGEVKLIGKAYGCKKVDSVSVP